MKHDQNQAPAPAKRHKRNSKAEDPNFSNATVVSESSNNSEQEELDIDDFIEAFDQLKSLVREFCNLVIYNEITTEDISDYLQEINEKNQQLQCDLPNFTDKLSKYNEEAICNNQDPFKLRDVKKLTHETGVLTQSFDSSLNKSKGSLENDAGFLSELSELCIKWKENLGLKTSTTFADKINQQKIEELAQKLINQFIKDVENQCAILYNKGNSDIDGFRKNLEDQNEKIRNLIEENRSLKKNSDIMKTYENNAHLVEKVNVLVFDSNYGRIGQEELLSSIYSQLDHYQEHNKIKRNRC